MEKLNIEPTKILWNEAYFTVGITDLRGIKDSVSLKFNSTKANVEPGVADNDLFASGITVKTNNLTGEGTIPFEMQLTLNGSSGLWVEALGKTTEVK
jgi:inner membrane protein